MYTQRRTIEYVLDIYRDREAGRFFYKGYQYLLARGWCTAVEEKDEQRGVLEGLSGLVVRHPTIDYIIGGISWYATVRTTQEQSVQWWVSTIYVEPEYRRQGIFAQLWDHFIEEAQIAQVKKISLATESTNVGMLQVNKLIGMEEQYRVFSKKL